jgi:urease accessory protein
MAWAGNPPVVGRVGAGVLPFLLLPAVAGAHAGDGDAALMTGLMHPVFGLDHLLAMVSVGVVSSQLGGGSVWRIPAAFVSAMTVGGAGGLARMPVLQAELGITVSVLMLGAAMLLAHRSMSPGPITALVAAFGLCHGYAHGLEIPKAASPALYTLGFVMSTATLHIVGVVVGEVTARQALRLAGGAVFASGAVLFLQSVSSMVG